MAAYYECSIKIMRTRTVAVGSWSEGLLRSTYGPAAEVRARCARADDRRTVWPAGRHYKRACPTATSLSVCIGVGGWGCPISVRVVRTVHASLAL